MQSALLNHGFAAKYRTWSVESRVSHNLTHSDAIIINVLVAPTIRLRFDSRTAVESRRIEVVTIALDSTRLDEYGCT